MHIFFGGPLTDLKDPEKTKSFYRAMGDVAASCGHTYYWAFLNGTDPVLNPDVSADVVYETDLAELAKADVFIIYLGEPSTGTGQEIEYAKEHDIPTYLMYETGKRITRMVLGSPNIKGCIEFASDEDGLSKLRTLLQSLR